MWYQVKVTTTIQETTPKGGQKEKNVKSQLLVEAVSVGDAEHQAYAYLQESKEPFEITGASQTNYEAVIGTATDLSK